MKKKPQDQRDWHEVRIETLREKNRSTAPADRREGNGASGDDGLKPVVLPKPGKRDGIGMANEPRAGIGTRGVGAAPKAKAARPKSAKNPQGADAAAKARATQRGYEEPRPAPREQPPDSLAHEEERQTGMSGQSSGT